MATSEATLSEERPGAALGEQRKGISFVRKMTYAFAVLASLGVAGLATSASAAPGAPMGVTAPDSTTQVYMTPMERRMMERRMMRRHMERRMMRREMMRREMRRDMRRGM